MVTVNWDTADSSTTQWTYTLIICGMMCRTSVVFHSCNGLTKIVSKAVNARSDSNNLQHCAMVHMWGLLVCPCTNWIRLQLLYPQYETIYLCLHITTTCCIHTYVHLLHFIPHHSNNILMTMWITCSNTNLEDLVQMSYTKPQDRFLLFALIILVIILGHDEQG